MKAEKEKIKVIVTDDHYLFRVGIVSVLRQIDFISEIKEAENGRQVLKLLSEDFYDLVFMDIVMQGMNGIEVTKIISIDFNQTRVIALSTYEDERYILEMMEAGALGYLLKNTTTEEVKSAIQKVMNNQICFSSQISNKAILTLISRHKNKMNANGNGLSKREKEILRLICAQLSTKEIAENLFLSEKTISWHRDNIMLKTESKNMVGLAIYAMRHGLLE